MGLRLIAMSPRGIGDKGAASVSDPIHPATNKTTGEMRLHAIFHLHQLCDRPNGRSALVLRRRELQITVAGFAARLHRLALLSPGSYNFDMHFLHRTCIGLLFTALIGCTQTVPAEHPTTAPSTYREADELRTALTYIASDQLEGRGLQTEGITKAADYIATRFRADGLKPPPGMDSYFQDVPITLSTQVGKNTALAIDSAPLAVKTDYMPLGTSGEGTFAGPVAFVGYAINNPDKNYDDFAGIDVKGKVVLAFRFEPTDAQSKSRFTGAGYSDHATFSSKAKAAAEHGAIALLVVNPPRGPDQLMSINSANTSTVEKSKIPVIHISRETATRLLQHTGADQFQDLKTLKSDLDQLHTHSFDIPNVTLSGCVEITHERKTFHNVLAWLPGVGAHKNEVVVVGAHYDHLGRGEIGSLAPNSHQIHHGADDNGSGTVAVLELAQELARHGSEERSILFATFVGEERGLLGSLHFVSHPPVPLDQIVAMLNLDMVGRVRNNVIFVGGNGTAQDFDELLDDADKDSPLILKNAGTDVGGRGGIGPSDHMSFAMKKIPVIFLWSGMHADYHRPTDTVDKINFVGIAETVDLCKTLLHELASTPREQYVDTYDHSGMSGMGGMKVRLGIMPDYNNDPAISGVRVAGTSPDAPAAKAGLREGDVIVAIDSDKIASLGDYMTVMSKHKPGDVIKIIVERDKQRLELSATLSEPRG
jgi:hypothetical protein